MYDDERFARSAKPRWSDDGKRRRSLGLAKPALVFGVGDEAGLDFAESGDAQDPLVTGRADEFGVERLRQLPEGHLLLPDRAGAPSMGSPFRIPR